MTHAATHPLPLTDPRAAPLVLVVPFCLAWSSAFAAGKIGLADCPPLLLLAFRFLMAGALLAAVAAWRGEYRGMTGRTLGLLALLGLLNHALYLGLGYSGLTHVSSRPTALIVSAHPGAAAAPRLVFYNPQ
ncbi:EamA family transporter, partial [Azospirillum formosense]